MASKPEICDSTPDETVTKTTCESVPSGFEDSDLEEDK